VAKTPRQSSSTARRGATGLPVPARSSRAQDPSPSEDWKDRPPTANWQDEEFEGFEEREDAAELADAINELNLAKKEIEERIAEKAALLNAIMSGYKDDESWSMASDEWTVTYVKPQPRKTLVPERLIEQGVSFAIIDKATKLTPVSPYVTVRAKKVQ